MQPQFSLGRGAPPIHGVGDLWGQTTLQTSLRGWGATLHPPKPPAMTQRQDGRGTDSEEMERWWSERCVRRGGHNNIE